MNWLENILKSLGEKIERLELENTVKDIQIEQLKQKLKKLEEAQTNE